MSRLEHLCWAIQIYEGFYPGTRAWKNRNPGNLRWSRLQNGNSGGFATFRSYWVGWLALYLDLWMKCRGLTRTGLGPKSTLLDLFRIYAPDEDGNNSELYAQFVADKLGIFLNTKLSYFNVKL